MVLLQQCGFLPELLTLTRPSTSFLSLFFPTFLRVGWQVVAAALSSLLLNRILYLICPFPRVAQSLKNSFTRISQEMKIMSRKPTFQSPVEDLCGSKAGMAIYTAQAFPSWGADPVREFEGCFLVYALRKAYVQGRRGSKFWEEIPQTPNCPWVINHGHRECPLLTCLLLFQKTLGHFSLKPIAFPLLTETAITSTVEVALGSIQTIETGTNARFGSGHH